MTHVNIILSLNIIGNVTTYPERELELLNNSVLNKALTAQELYKELKESIELLFA